LLLWLETTSDKSFDDQFQDNGQTPNQWYDINPQNPQKFTAVQNTAANKPVFTDNFINGLPVLKFDGVNDSMAIPYDPMLNPTNVTMFVVTQLPSTADGFIAGPISSGGNCCKGYEFAIITAAWSSYFGIGGAFAGTSALISASIAPINKPAVVTISNDAVTARLYLNGTQQGSQAYSMVPNATGPFSIGGEPTSGNINGYIAEIIAFERILKTEEQKAVEAYLGKKWGVKVS
jgi:hypothetical protein